MRTILLPFFDDQAASAALAVSWTLAERFGAHLEGVFILRPPQVFDGEGIALAGSYLTQIKEEGRRLADSAASRFEDEMRGRGIELAPLDPAARSASASWRELDGLEGQVIGEHGRLFDLVVVGRDYGQPWIDWNVVCEAALFESGRPVLVASATPPQTLGERIVVAWNGSTESARSVSFAMPLLAAAREVTVLTVEGGTVPGPAVPSSPGTWRATASRRSSAARCSPGAALARRSRTRPGNSRPI